MKSDTKLRTISILSLIGLITSIYLVYNHYAPPQAGSFCDFGETVSCSLVNTSVYSELFGVPVALFGAVWFIILGLMGWKATTKKELLPGILAWSVLGMLFVVYMIIAEIILQAVCPLCTFVHLIVLIVLLLCISLYQSQAVKWSWSPLKKWIALVVVLNLLPLLILNWPAGEEVNYDSLAQCMTDNGVVMYGSFRCGVCARTREMFGDSFQYVKEIECHPQGENAQTELCIAKQIEGTPTWAIEQNGEEIKRHTGFLTIDELQEFSGCQE